MAKRTSISVRRPPWRKWYPQDWRADAPLRMCSFAARGLWIDLLGLMHESTPVGLLLVNGVPPSTRQLAGLLGGTEREIKKLLAELGNANVYSVTGNALPADLGKLIPTGLSSGILFSRRMVRDEAKALQDRLNGSAGGNPNLPPRDTPEHQGGDRQDNDPLNEGVNPQANPQIPDARGEAPTGLPPEENHTTSPVAARATGLEGPHAHDGAVVADVVAAATARLRVVA
jgi:hypothetical protein